MSEMHWKVGDHVVHYTAGYAGAIREIVVVRPGSGYDWRYPSVGEFCKDGQRNLFASENSSDPFMEPIMGWRLYTEEQRRKAREWSAEMDMFLNKFIDNVLSRRKTER